MQCVIRYIEDCKDGVNMELEEFLQGIKNGDKILKECRQKAKCFVKGTNILTDKGIVTVENFIPEINITKWFTMFSETCVWW